MPSGETMIAKPDLSPRKDAPLQWWFVEGQFRDETRGVYDFMVSVFRAKITREQRQPGYMLLVSLFDHETAASLYRSEISGSMVDAFLHLDPTRSRKNATMHDIEHAFWEEIRLHGVPKPLVKSEEPDLFDETTLDIRWNDVSLSEVDDTIALKFNLPGCGSECSLTLRPERGWLGNTYNEQKKDDEMSYENCPRLAVSGQFKQGAVTGHAWFDHQWGELDWLFRKDTGGELLGWQWFGINLDDQTDLLLIKRHAYMSEEILQALCVYYGPDDDGAPRLIKTFDLLPQRHWTSRRTKASYPVEWLIEIPELDASLRFTPLIDDQEIPVFGLVNAIWEGAGTVSGTINGKEVSGRARLELHGYSNILDHDQSLNQWGRQIDAIISDFLPETLTDETLASFAGKPSWGYDSTAQTDMLIKPVWDLLKRGGKRWRPIFGFLLMEMLETDHRPFQTMLAVIPELIHNGSVIIDDIEDKSQMRRGGPCLHHGYGMPSAINAGNMLYFLPILSLANHPALSFEQRDEIYQILIEVFVRAHMGQAQDLYFSESGLRRDAAFWQDNQLEGHILQMHAFKTAAPVMALAEIVCVIAGTSQGLARKACSLHRGDGRCLPDCRRHQQFHQGASLGQGARGRPVCWQNQLHDFQGHGDASP
ncbi:polyprenyl synthetase family protein [uncultured Cohaesibacter sp.]|uniref:polyprenyl synthetase family protein n=1 Tax=uncultured Cohaesibacter sp. TaxID=1002546 RepID=UPI002930D24D|nr:polyprenyl synthetase family protein [uncultured Cohaesibacter sp.]